MKAFGYLRVSSNGQVSGHGFVRQRKSIEEFAKANRMEMVDWFQDSHTGTEIDRPEFARLLSTCNGTKTVIVESLDRLARDLMVQNALLAKLKGAGIRLIAANTGEDVTDAFENDPMRKAIVQVQGVFAELDKGLLVRKLRKAREAKRAESGRCEGRKPYGFFEGEEEVIKYIKKLRRKPRYGKRMSFAKIAERLNAEAIPPRAGSRWHTTQIQRVLGT